MAQKLQNSEIPRENEGSGARLVKNQRKMKVLASCCWVMKRVSGGLNNRPTGLKNNEKRKVWGPGAFSRTLATYATSRLVFPGTPRLVPGP